MGLSRHLPDSLKLLRYRLRTWARTHVVPHFNDLRFGGMPVAMITGSAGKTTTSRLVASILKQQGHVVGLACTDGLFVDGAKVLSGDSAGYRGARVLMRDRRISAAVLETARGGLRSEGLFMKRRKVGALLNVGYEHVGMNGIGTVEQMAALKRRVVAGARYAVLNADNAHTAAIAETLQPRRLVLFSLDAASPLVARTIAAGGRAVVASEGALVLVGDGLPAPLPLIDLADIPVTLGGRAEHYCANALAAAAIGWALDAPFPAIAEGLAALKGGLEQNPGRWTIFEGYPFTLVAERGSSPANFGATARFVESLAPRENRLLMMTSSGKRADEQYRQFTVIAARVFDRFVVYDNLAYLGDRRPGELPAILSAMLVDAGVAPARIETTPNVEDGLRRTATLARPGDFVLLHLQQLPDIAPAVVEAFEPRLDMPSDKVAID